MDELKIIRDKRLLRGATCYMEVFPGKYTGGCWHEESIYFEEEAFRPIEYIIEGVVPGYSHYSFIDIEKDQWTRIIERLRQLVVFIRNAQEPWEVEADVHFMSERTQREFDSDFSNNKDQLIKMISEFCEWLETRLESTQSIAVLGL